MVFKSRNDPSFLDERPSWPFFMQLLGQQVEPEQSYVRVRVRMSVCVCAHVYVHVHVHVCASVSCLLPFLVDHFSV